MISQKLQIKLFHNSGLSWFYKDNFYAKGYLYDSEGNYYSGYELIELISTFDLDAFLSFLCEANGAFAIIWKKEENTVLAVDPVRSIPVFYSWHEESFVVSDDALAIARFKGKQTLDESIYKFIRLSGFAPGNSTLFPDIHQLNGGQYLHLKNNSVSTQPEFYYRHFHKSDSVSSESLWKERFSVVLNNIFYRLIDSLKNDTIVLPLSGGFDSRLIAAMLKEIEYENVICYTYGRENSYEVKIAKEVARNLQYPWYFIEYKADLFEKYFDSQAKDYREFAGNGCCSVQEQEYFAVSELVSRKLIPENSVFVPGYCGDLPAGSYLPNRYQVSRIVHSKSNAIDFIIEKHFKSHRDNPDFLVIKEHLQEQFESAKWKDIDDFISIHENWFTLNKVSKYVVNGIRAFEFFGYKWRLPLWDKEFIGFFYSLPNEQRFDKKFYKHYLLNQLFSKYNITDTPDLIDNYFTHDSTLNRLKYLIPEGLKKVVKRLLIKKQVRDINAFSELYDLVNGKIYNGDFEDKNKNLNYILASWYLKEVAENITANES